MISDYRWFIENLPKELRDLTFTFWSPSKSLLAHVDWETRKYETYLQAQNGMEDYNPFPHMKLDWRV